VTFTWGYCSLEGKTLAGAAELLHRQCTYNECQHNEQESRQNDGCYQELVDQSRSTPTASSMMAITALLWPTL